MRRATKLFSGLLLIAIIFGCSYTPPEGAVDIREYIAPKENGEYILHYAQMQNGQLVRSARKMAVSGDMVKMTYVHMHTGQDVDPETYEFNRQSVDVTKELEYSINKHATLTGSQPRYYKLGEPLKCCRAFINGDDSEYVSRGGYPIFTDKDISNISHPNVIRPHGPCILAQDRHAQGGTLFFTMYCKGIGRVVSGDVVDGNLIPQQVLERLEKSY